METNRLASEPVSTSARGSRSAIPAAIACLSLLAVSVVLLEAYSLLHWRILRDNYPVLHDPLKKDLFRLLGMLEIYHLTALLSAGFGVATFWGRPEWLRWICGLASAGALLIYCTIM
jgi:hypothetical protein